MSDLHVGEGLFRPELLTAAVERLTARDVRVFMSANHIAPDTAAEIFLLDAKAGA